MPFVSIFQAVGVSRPVCSVSAVTQCVSDGKQDDLILRWIINDIFKDDDEREKIFRKI